MTWFKRVSMPDDGDGDVVPGRTGLGADFQPDSLESSLHWGVVWPQVIAKAWTDQGFHDEVKASPRAAIRKYFGYDLSPNLELTIKDLENAEDAEAAAFVEEDNNPLTAKDPWAGLPPLKLTVVIPPPPPDNLQAVAITAYQDTGRTYPFTCC